MTFGTPEVMAARVRRRAELEVQQLTRDDHTVSVLRHGGTVPVRATETVPADWVEVPARDVVPGDLIRVREGEHICCDCVVVRGNVVVNESSLTGEPMPIQKFPFDLHSADFEEVLR